MACKWRSVWLGLLGACLLLPAAALAQAACPAGVAANGECVDAGLAGNAIENAIILSQPKISYTAYPVLPNGDSNYRYPNQLNPDPQGSSSAENPGRASGRRRR